MQGALARLYSDFGKHRRGGPLTLASRAFVIALVIGYMGTWVLYSASNALLEGRFRHLLATGVEAPIGIQDEPALQCDAEINGVSSRTDSADRVSAKFACGLAEAADPLRFDSFEISNDIGRKDLVKRLAVVFRGAASTRPRLTVHELSQFVTQLGEDSAGTERVPISSRFRRVDADSPISETMQISALEELIGGRKLGPISRMNALTGMRTYAPGKIGVEQLLFLEPSVGSAQRDRQWRLDALALVEGLVDRLKSETFWSWRIGQALNGLIQWVTVWIACSCVVLLWFRRRWAAFGTEMLSMYVDRGQVPAMLARADSTRRRVGWHADAETVEAVKSNHAFLPGRLICDAALRQGDANSAAASALQNVIDVYEDDCAASDYSGINWMIDAIPTLGFLGTVYGMIMAMGGAGAVVGAQTQQALKLSMGELSRNLGTAFDTTAVALVLAMIVTLSRARTKRMEVWFFLALRESTQRLIGVPKVGQ